MDSPGESSPIMSFDVIVWLGCAVSLPQALPDAPKWTHYHTSMSVPEGLPPAIAAQFRDIETWQLVRETHLINASYASKTRLTFENVRVIAPDISISTIGAPNASQNAAADARQVELEAGARAAKVGISLVLEGVSDDGVKELMAMSGHLAQTCGGAVIEAPTGFHRIDASGREIE
jgi:hypothetical protein